MNVITIIALTIALPKIASAEGYHYLIAGSDANTSAKFVDGSTSDNPSEGFDTTINFENKNAIAYEYRDSKEDDWGYSFGYIRHQKSLVIDVKKDDLAQFDYDEDEIEIHTIYLDAIYKWKRFYLSFGFNKSEINFKNEDSTLAVESTTSIGSNFAFGWELTSWVIVEYGAKVNPWVLKKTSTAGVTTDYGVGSIGVATLQLKIRVW
jgi:hypothetical protein